MLLCCLLVTADIPFVFPQGRPKGNSAAARAARSYTPAQKTLARCSDLFMMFNSLGTPVGIVGDSEENTRGIRTIYVQSQQNCVKYI